jgi:DNA invertase Pin-like site-specific DNA recombinase
MEKALAAGYARVSSQIQAEKGVSLKAQAEKIRAMAVVQNVEITEIIIDAGESAGSLDRPGMKKLLNLVERKEVEKVIIFKLDRLTRSVKDLAGLLELFERKEVGLVSVEESLDTATAAGRLVINVMAAVSQWEREAVGERTSMALQFKKSKGEFTGTAIYGYKVAGDGKKLIEDTGEQEFIALIVKLRKRTLSYQRIANKLNELGYTNRKGGEWKPQYVCGIYKAAIARKK